MRILNTRVQGCFVQDENNKAGLVVTDVQLYHLKSSIFSGTQHHALIEDASHLQTTTFWFNGNSPQPAEAQHPDNTDFQQQVP